MTERDRETFQGWLEKQGVCRCVSYPVRLPKAFMSYDR